MAASNTVNNLVALVYDWLENTSAGRSVMDIYDTIPGKPGTAPQQRFSHSDARAVILYELDEKTGAYKFSQQMPVKDRADIITKVRELGGR